MFFALNRFYLLLPTHLPGGPFPPDQHLHHLPAGADRHALIWRNRLVKVLLIVGFFSNASVHDSRSELDVHFLSVFTVNGHF